MFNRFHRALAVALFAVAANVGAHHIEGAPSAPQIPSHSSVAAPFQGYVDDLVVENRIAGTTTRFAVFVGDDGRRMLLKGANTETLAAGTAIALIGKLDGRTLFAEGTPQILPGDASQALAKAAPSTTVSGMLRLGHADNFDGQPSEFFFTLFGHDGSRSDVKLAALLGLLTNRMEVTVTGRVAADGELIADHIAIDAMPGAEQKADAVAKATVTNQVLVIPIKFKDINGVFPADPFTVASITTAVFGTAPTQSVAEYYKEVSFNQQLLAGTVANVNGTWLKAATAAPIPVGCDYTYIGTQGDAAATAAGYNINNYPNRVYVFASSGFSCGWAGLAYVGWGRSWIKQTTNLLVLVHELGHNFGLLHAASLDCGTQPIGGACSASEYGDPFDTMGNQRAMHFNAMQKRLLNWIPASSTPTHPLGTSTYTLTPIETAGGAQYAVRIPTPLTNRTYWVEYRQPIGFDSGLSAFPNNGAQVRVASPFETTSGSDDTQFLDMTPATGAFTDGTLLVGQSYTDPNYGITINVQSVVNGKLSVQVTSTTGAAATTTTLASSLNPSTVGANVTFTASVTGSSPTGTVAFKDGAGVIGVCGAVALAGTGNTRTATCTVSTLTQGAHSMTAVYAGNAANLTSTSAALSQVVNAAAPVATTTTVASSLNPSTVGAGVTFTASVTGVGPTGNVAFKDGATNICAAVALAGTGNTRTATCTTSALTQATHSITAVYAGGAGNLTSTSAALSQVVNAAGGASTNVASASNGGVPTVSSTYGAGYLASSLNNNERAGSGWGSGDGGWLSSGPTLPQWAQITFNGSKTIDKVVVYSVQDNYPSPIQPLDTTTFSKYGVVNFNVQAWNGTSWYTLAIVTGNNLVKRTVAFSAVTTDRIRVNISGTSDGWSRLTEIEAWSTGAAPPPPTTTTTSLASSANPSMVGAGVTFTASVTGAAPTGNVAFKDGATNICAAVALAGTGNTRTATCTTSALTQATHSITAVYAGGAGNLTSTSAALSQVVNAAGGASTNVALASNGGVPTVSSTYGAGYLASSLNNNESAGSSWGSGGGWLSSGPTLPQWAQITFNGSKTIDKVVIYSVQDNYTGPIQPLDTTTFSTYGVVNFNVQAWNGASWYTLAIVTGNNLVKRTVTFSAVTTDRIRVNISGTSDGWSRLTEIEAWGTGAAPPGGGASNVALASNGGVPTVSSTYGAGYLASSLNNNESAGSSWGSGGGWLSSGPTLPQWAQITFNGSKTIDKVVIYSVQDNYTGPIQPLDTTTFSTYGVVNFNVQAWNGASWYTLAIVTGNNLVKRTVTFSAVTTDRIRVNISGTSDGWSRLTEIEAWGTGAAPPGGGASNVALASNGGVPTVSSTYGAGYLASSLNNNESAGSSWGSGGGWLSSGPTLPQWAQITFNGSKTIDKVVIYSVQDNYTGPIQPLDTTTFSTYGVVNFNVQAWNGASWYTLAIVTGNNLVKRTMTFSAVTTDRIRVNISGTSDGWSRLTEIEAWSTGAAPPPPTGTALASSANPSMVGTNVTFTASVTGAAPTGNVAFKDGASDLCPAVPLAGTGNTRTAVCTTPALAQGTRSVIAAYAGDAGNAPSASAPVTQVVNTAGGGGGGGGAASCAGLTTQDFRAFDFDGSTLFVDLGKGDKDVAIISYTAQPGDVGKVADLNVVEHGSGIHYYTVWASKVRCEMTTATQKSSNSSPTVFVSVNGGQSVNMQVGETWYFMVRNWRAATGANTCSDNTCGTLVSKHLWR